MSSLQMSATKIFSQSCTISLVSLCHSSECGSPYQHLPDKCILLVVNKHFGRCFYSPLQVTSSSGLLCHSIHTRFCKNRSTYSKGERGDNTDNMV